jgi:integrase
MAKPKHLVVVRIREDRGKPEIDYVDLDGRRHRRVFDSEEKAHAEAAKIAARLNDGLPADPDGDDPLKQIKVREYVDRFLREQAHLAPRTLASYRAHLSGVVTEQLGHLRVRDLRRRHVKALLGSLRDRTYTRGKAEDAEARAYSPDTIRLVRASLSALLSAAVDDEILDVNPCLGGRRGRRPGVPTKAKRLAHIRPLSADELDRVLVAAGAARPLYETLAKAGLRPSEAFALRVTDLDLDKRTLLVERSLELDGTERPTKTYQTRIVRLTASLVRTLRAYVPRLKAQALKRGWGPPSLLFPTQANTPQDHTKVAKAFKAALRAANVSLHHRPYDLRHSYASLMLMRGAPLTFVSHQLGHANPTTTLRYYARWIPGEGDQFVDLLEPDAGTNARQVVGGESEPVDSAGAGGGSRTRDLLITNQLLCH